MKPKRSTQSPRPQGDALQLPGAPSANPAVFTLPQDKVILIVDKPTALRWLGSNKSDSLPS